MLEITPPKERKPCMFSGLVQLPIAAHSALCCLSVGVSGPRLGENCEQVLVSKEKHDVQTRGLWEGSIPSWWHENVIFKEKQEEAFYYLPLSYWKVKYLDAYSSRIKTAARCR